MKQRLHFLKRLSVLFVLFGLMALPGVGWGQTTLFSDNFNSNNSETWSTSAGAIGDYSNWSVSLSGVDWGARVANNQLELTNDASGTANANGWIFGYRDINALSGWNTTLSNNSGTITWEFNIRVNRSNLAGFGGLNYGLAYILSGTNTNTNSLGSGYALVLGNSLTPDPFRLVSYNTGLAGTQTTIITSNTTGFTDIATDYYSVRVTYIPTSNTWELFLRNDGASAFADPASGSLTSQGTAVNSDYTSTAGMRYLGGYWQGSTAGSQTAFFDNIFLKVTLPNVEISSDHPTGTNISQLSTNNILASFKLDVLTADAILNGISVTTAGTYTASDIATNGFKFWINSSNNLTGATQLGSSQAAVGSGNAVAVSGLSQAISSGTTRYILLTADISVGATATNTIRIGTTSFANITFASGNKTGIDPVDASNDMTIIECTPTNITGLSLTPGNTQITISWTNPACYDEVMIVAKPTSTIGASPIGDGTAYTDNLAFGSGTTFDGTGYVVYKGSASPQTITGLANGTTYYIKVFTRKGSVWSSGEESSATPASIVVWANSVGGTAWFTDANWNPLRSSGNWQIIDIAQFQNTGSATTAGINMGTAFLSLGAIEVTSARTRALTIGNSSGTAGTLTLNGTIVNSINQTVIRNHSNSTFTIQDNETGTGKTMNVSFANPTNNIIRVDGTGNIIIGSSITSALGPVTISGSGSGMVEFTGQNIYATNTIVSGSTLRLNRVGGTTIPSTNNITVNGGTFRVSSNQTLNNLTIEEGGNLLVDGGVTLTINGNLTLNESVTISGNLVIGSNGTSEVVLGKTLTNNGTLTIKSGLSGTGSIIVYGNINGSGTFSLERYFPQIAQTWHFLSAPVNGSILSNGFNPGGAEDFFTWSESSPGTWVNYKNTTESPTFAEANGSDFVKGRGYLVAYTGANPTKTFTTGTITTGNVDIQLKRSAAKSWTYEPGWNLLGNPYTSGIEWNLANRTKFEDNFAYVYDPNKIGGAGFVNINGGIASAYIAANQGFFVRVKVGENDENFTFTNAMQVANGSFMKQQTMEDQLVLKLNFGDYFDKTYIQINAESSAVRDRNDALKMFSYDINVPQLFSKSSNDVRLAFNSIPELNEITQVALGLRAPAQGAYSIEVAESSNVFHANSLFLKDQKLNVMHNLSQNPVYSFTSAEGDDPNRFLLHFGLVSVGEQLPTETLQAYAYDNRLYVNSSLEKASLSVYDLQGRLLLQRQINERGLQSVEIKMPAGVYIVRLQNTLQSKSVKIVVQ